MSSKTATTSTRPHSPQTYEDINLPPWPTSTPHSTPASITAPSHEEENEESQIHPIQNALPPTDQGYQAWLALFGSFLSNYLIWGFALSFGVMQEYYTTHEPFSSQSGIAAIGTTSTGLMYLTTPLYFWLFQRWPKARQWALYASLPITGASLIGASFTDKVEGLLVCQGVVYAIGGNALVLPSISYINEWFMRKKGLALGIAIAGDGTGGVVMPLVLQALLGKVGLAWTLRIAAAMIVIPAAPLPFILKPRLPVSASHAAPPVDASFLKSPLFWMMQFFNTIEALGYFLPSNYLPSIAESLGLNSTLGSLTNVFINFAAVFGCIGVGVLVDRFEVTTVTLFISILAGLAVFCILGFATSIAPLYIFSIVYGLAAGGYSTNWAGMIRLVQEKYEGADANLIFGLFAAGRGVGSIVSGPLSESLLERSKGFSDSAISAYGSEYGNIIIFAGTTAVAGGLGWFVRKAGVI